MGTMHTAERPEITARERARMRHKHIFAINGSQPFLDLLRDLFADERYNVTTTNFVDRTFDMISVLQPDLLLVDLVVQQQAGWDLLERLQREALTLGIPVLVTSTDSRLLSSVSQEPERYGSHSVMALPLDIESILSHVDELIGQA